MQTKGPVPAQHLSGVDAAFLYLERKELPLHMAGVCIFDGPIPFTEFVRQIDSRLHLVPRYRQVVVAPPYDLSYPTWQDDPHFDIGRHIIPVRLERPGGDPQLEALAASILSRVMDRRRPLWDIHVVDGLKHGRGALIIRLHHALADGIAGLALATKLILDASPQTRPAKRTARRPAAPLPARQLSLAETIATGIHSSLEHLVAAEAGILEIGQTLLSDWSRLGAAQLLPELLRAVERLPFNKQCGDGRKFCWAEFDLAQAQAIRAAAGGTINDVVLTVLTRAMARYVKLHGQSVVNRLIRVVCPVNLRRDHADCAGNQLTFMPVVLPMDIAEPVRMLQAVAARTTMMKQARAGDMLAVVANLLGATPPAVQKMMWRGISQITLPLPLFNIICTNVPGSPEPLYCLGRRMLASYPQVPTGYELGINCAVQSYDGKLFFGLIADPAVAPDVARLRDFLRPAWQELCRAAGVRQQRRRAPAARKPRPRRAKPAEPAPVAAPPVAPAAPAEPEPAPPAAAAAAGNN